MKTILRLICFTIIICFSTSNFETQAQYSAPVSESLMGVLLGKNYKTVAEIERAIQNMTKVINQSSAIRKKLEDSNKKYQKVSPALKKIGVGKKAFQLQYSIIEEYSKTLNQIEYLQKQNIEVNNSFIVFAKTQFEKSTQNLNDINTTLSKKVKMKTAQRLKLCNKYYSQMIINQNRIVACNIKLRAVIIDHQLNKSAEISRTVF